LCAWFGDAHICYFHAARNAIYKAFSLLGLQAGDEILVPAYNCGSEVDALLQAGARIRFFQVSRAMEIDEADLLSRISPATRAIYVIHYFGFPQPIASLANFCESKGLFLVEDCALSSFTEVDGSRIGLAGDVAIYNFPKCLPVPDGGALVSNNLKLGAGAKPGRKPETSVILSRTLRLLGQSALRTLPATCVPLFRFKHSSASPVPRLGVRPDMPRSYYLDARQANRNMSALTSRLMRGIDLSEVRRRRRRNFLRMHARLSRQPGLQSLFPQLPAGACPLVFPVLVDNPRQVADCLQQASIPAIAWWSGYHQGCNEWDHFSDACYLKDHLLALPIHQQLDVSAIDYIAHKLVGCLPAGANHSAKRASV
jgi:dTDP-4-amino-4,6-dideoxygalactose transaminase